MPSQRPTKSFAGLALGLVLAAPTSARAATAPDVGQLADGLLALALYLPAGIVLAAVALECLARGKPSSSLHNGVLTVLAAAGITSIIALAITLAVPETSLALRGSPFASLLTGSVFTAIVLATWVAKGLSLRGAATVSQTAPPEKPPARRRGRSRGRRGGIKGKVPGSPGSPLRGFVRCAYLGCLAATLGCLVASPMFLDPAPQPIVASTVPPPAVPATVPHKAPAAPAEIEQNPLATADKAEPLAVNRSPDPAPAAVPQPEMVPAAPEPQPAAATVATTTPSTVPTDPQPAPDAVAVPTPPVRPVSTDTGGLAGAETYKQLIQPLLRSRCYDCHGTEKQKGDLRLDTPEGIRKGGKSGPIIIAGNPEESHLFELVNLDPDDADIMPPKGKPLSESQISWIGGWIREGAALGDGESWPVAEGGTVSAIDSLAGGVPASDQAATQRLLDGGVIVRKLDSAGKLLEIDFSHAGRPAGGLRLDELAPLAANIHTLDLKRTKISDADLKILSALSNLRVLHLQRTEITDAAIQHLSSLTNLESLNLYATKVSDASLPELKKLTSLKKIYLWSTAVTPDGARDLASVLGADVVNMGE